MKPVLLFAALLAACTGGSGGPAAKDHPTDAAPATDAVVAPPKLVEVPRVKPKWDPKGGDPSVPAELGGPGFTGEGWTTNDAAYQWGRPDAPQGGTMTIDMDDWPPTLRLEGKDWNTYFNYFVYPLVLMPLLDLDPVSMEFVPALATHWQISEDKQTYRFRIDPAARWSDGKEVTAEDVVATYKFKMDPGLLDPSNIVTFGKLHPPKAVSKYIVEVQVKEENWRNFLYFATQTIFPAHEVGHITGAEYLDKYQFAYTVGNGPYHVKPEDIVTGNSITISRRTDWWAEDNPIYDGLYNIGAFKWVIVKDPQLRFEKVKKGEIDYMVVPKAQWWAEEIPNLDQVKRGLLVPRKFYNAAPIGYSGLALNQKRPPLDDVRVRKALQYLYDRETMIEKLFFNEYEPHKSYYEGVYANPANRVVPYDEVAAVELLEQAGWTETDAEGYRVKDGKRLGFTVTYRTPLSERSLTVFQESCKRAGIKIDLQLLSDATAWKNLQEKQFEISDQAWGGLEFPNPETSWLGSLADVPNNNNVTGFSNKRVDELCKEYDREYDVQRRVELIREIDGILYNEFPYALAWYNPAQRVLFWNKFGMPEWGGHRYARADRQLFLNWWVDPTLEKQLAEAMQDPTKTMDPGSRENRFWQEWAKVHGGGGSADAPGSK